MSQRLVVASASAASSRGEAAPLEARRERRRELGSELRGRAAREPVDVHPGHVVDDRVGGLGLEAGSHEERPALGLHLADPVGIERRIAAIVPEDARDDPGLASGGPGQHRRQARVLALREDDVAAP